MDWTNEMQQTLATLAGEGRATSQIASALGVTRNAVIGRARRTGVPLLYASTPREPREPRKRRSRKGRGPSESRVAKAARNQEIARRWAAGESCRQIADDYDLTELFVSQIARKLGCPPRRVISWDTSKRPEGVVLDALTMLALGMTFREAARKSGLGVSSLQRWKHQGTYWQRALAIAAPIKAQMDRERAARQADEERERAMRMAARAAKADAARRHNMAVLPALSPRQAEMVKAYSDLGSLEAAGRRIGVTRERIRQVLVAAEQRGLLPEHGRAERRA